MEITKEQAIYILTHIAIKGGYGAGKTLIQESVDLAVKALQAIPCNDSISRKDVVDVIDSHALFKSHPLDYDAYQMALSHLKEFVLTAPLASQCVKPNLADMRED